MKVVLIWARVPIDINISAPLGICYIAAQIRDELPVDVDIIDANQEKLSIDDALKKILDKNYDVVGISFMTPQADYAFELSKRIKEIDENILVVHGGVHPTLRPFDSMKNNADYCVIGEGEITFKELLESIINGEEPVNVRGIARWDNGEIKINEPREFVKDLDTLLYPAFDLVPISEYEENLHIRKGLAIPIMASRGCPFNCSFCASPTVWRRVVRYRSAGNIIDEIEKYIKEYNVRKFHFYDDNFLLSAKRMNEFCDLVIQRGLDIEWICLGRSDTINRHPEVLNKMKQAGCVGLEIGVETLDENVLKSTSKKITADESLNALRHILNSGLEIACVQLMTFNVGETIFGHYFQNRKLMEITGDRRIFFGQFATPYPGTRFAETASKDGLVLVENWSDYVTTNLNFIPRTLLDEKPKRSLRRLRISDLAIIMKEYSRIQNPEALQLRSILSNQKIIRFFYSQCQGNNRVEDISKSMSSTFKMDYKEALDYTMKLVVIMSQLGLIKPENRDHYSQKITPDWQKRFYGIDSNSKMNMVWLSKYFKLKGARLRQRFSPH
jgi:radical SAM superfamily enzyme YgiQ (UPF0313 family)